MKKNNISKHDLSRIGGRLSYLRDSLGMSMRQLADIIGLTSGNISNLEHHKYEPSFKVLAQITKQFGVSPEWLMLGTGQPFMEKAVNESNPPHITGKPPHSLIIEKFRQQDVAWDISWNLYRLEQLNPEALRELNELIEFKLQKLAGKVEYDRRQRQRRIVKDKDRAPDEERRVAERRIASGE